MPGRNQRFYDGGSVTIEKREELNVADDDAMRLAVPPRRPDDIITRRPLNDRTNGMSTDDGGAGVRGCGIYVADAAGAQFYFSVQCDRRICQLTSKLVYVGSICGMSRIDHFQF